MKLEIKIDNRGVIAALAKAPDVFSREVRKDIKDKMEDVVSYAAKNANFEYKYSRPTGEAARSMVPSVSNDGLSAVIELDPSIANAPYARRVHEGGGGKADSKGRKMTNKPNQFLYRAFDKKKDEIASTYETALAAAFRKVGF